VFPTRSNSYASCSSLSEYYEWVGRSPRVPPIGSCVLIGASSSNSSFSTGLEIVSSRVPLVGSTRGTSSYRGACGSVECHESFVYASRGLVICS
jgi:hypothetical protein